MPRLQGELARRSIITTKLTESQHDRIRGLAKAQGKTVSEWTRDQLVSAIQQQERRSA